MITDSLEKSPYFETMIRRSWITWLWAAAGALGLNIVLFALMPHLQHPVREKPDFEQIVSAINVIRIRQPESPVKRETEKPPEPPEPMPRTQQPRPRPSIRQPVQTKLALPFAINPRLPAGPDTLVLPPPVVPPMIFDTSDANAPVAEESFPVSVPDQTFSEGDLDSPLTVLARVPPIYPMTAKRRGIEGWVRVRFVVSKDGSVGSIKVVESKPSGIFDQSVVRCVSGWRFQPGKVGGSAVSTRVETTVRFELE
ncbi:MAG: TonB family protein [Desulfococcaceae bacterium]